MLAKISSARRDFRITGLADWRVADRLGRGLGRFSTLPTVVGVRAFGSGAAPTPREGLPDPVLDFNPVPDGKSETPPLAICRK
jgi:hypothetical protein